MDNIIYTIENLYNRNKVKSLYIYTAVVVMVLLVFILLPIVKVDVSSQSSGIVRSRSENVMLSPVVSGRVLYVNLENNKRVKKGDTLLILDAQNLDAQVRTNTDLESDYQAILADLDKLNVGDYKNLNTAEMLKEYQSYLQKRQEAQVRAIQTEKNYNRQKILHKRGAISDTEMERLEYEYKSASAALRSVEEQQKATWQTRRREVLQQIRNYSGTLNEISANKKNYIITAPISGNIMNYSGIQRGAYLNTSQNVAEISANDELLVECYVLPKDIGLLRKGQKVFFQVEAYNYNQWGLMEGRVVDIDKNITMSNDGQTQNHFKVRCKLKKNYLQLSNGYKGEISKGMTLTARFIINRRSLYNLLFDKVDDWMNPKIMTTEDKSKS